MMNPMNPMMSLPFQMMQGGGGAVSGVFPMQNMQK